MYHIIISHLLLQTLVNRTVTTKPNLDMAKVYINNKNRVYTTDRIEMVTEFSR